MKKIVSLSVRAAVTMLSFTGCRDKTNITPKKLEKKFKTITDEMNSKQDYAVQYIRIDKFFYKSDNLNHTGLPNMKFTLEEKGVTSLENILKKLPIPAMADNSIKKNYLYLNDSFDGTLEEVLEQIASLSNSYWTFDNGIIKFVKTKSMVYKIPLINNKLNTIYNVGAQTTSTFDMSKITNDIFTELQAAITMTLQGEDFTGEINYSFSNGEKDINKNVSNNTSVAELKKIKDQLETRDNNLQIIKDNKLLEQIKDNNKINTRNNEENGITKGNTSNSGIVPKNSIKNITQDQQIKDTIIDKNNSDVKQDKKVTTNTDKNTNVNTNTDSSNVNKNKESENNKELTETYEFKTTYTAKTNKSSFSSEAGMFIVEIDRKNEEKINKIVENVIKNTLSTLIDIKFYILEIANKNSKDFNTNLTSAITRVGAQTKTYGFDTTDGFVFGLNNGSQALNTTVENFLTTDSVGNALSFIDPTSQLSNITGLVNYLITNENSKIMSSPRIISMPNIPSRIKATVDVPYIEPQLSSTSDGELTYEIKFVNDGLDMAVVSNVVDDSIYLSLGISINQYISDKTIQAGSLGTISIPVQAPRILNNTVRIKAGDSTIIGGLKKYRTSIGDTTNLFIPQSDVKGLEESEIVIITVPKMIKFVTKEEMNKKINEVKEKLKSKQNLNIINDKTKNILLIDSKNFEVKNKSKSNTSKIKIEENIDNK